MFVNNNLVSLRMRLAMIQGNIYSIFNTLKDENFQVLKRLKTLCTISTKLTLQVVAEFQSPERKKKNSKPLHF